MVQRRQWCEKDLADVPFKHTASVTPTPITLSATADVSVVSSTR